MKNLKLAFLVAFLLISSTMNSAKAQATIERETISITLTFGGTVYELNSGDVFIRNTPSGNYIRTLSFTVDETNPIYFLPDPWAFFLGASYKITIDGEEVTLIGIAVITNGGVVKIRYISNGSGTVFSPGRF